MRIQLLSDLHLESETFDPEPLPAAELLVLAGDIDTTWNALPRFRGWPVPVIMVAGNHEFDGRELRTTWPQLRWYCDSLGIRLIEQEELLLTDDAGRRIRVLGTVRWCDFDLFGPAQRDRCQRAGSYFARVMRSTVDGRVFGTQEVRDEALLCRQWLEHALRTPRAGCDATLVITHFAPSLLSADPRYGSQPGTASFCNADDDLLPWANVWVHGHLHCRHDYVVRHARGATRVVCQARGLGLRDEPEGFDPYKLIEV